ncbi:MAG: hypothetical protein QNJ14_11815 [Woeseiaceae bacterium]|nr:hypothetical protein [Woeseiaceae bacterium]
MSKIHLNDIRQCLESAQWKIVEELDGDGYRISGVWVIARPDGTNLFHLDFEGLDDMETLPVEQSYACAIREAPYVSCYFSRPGRSWPNELANFENMLREWGGS